MDRLELRRARELTNTGAPLAAAFSSEKNCKKGTSQGNNFTQLLVKLQRYHNI